MEFFKTDMGKRFYSVDLPALIMQLKRIADGLDKLNKNMEKKPTEIKEKKV